MPKKLTKEMIERATIEANKGRDEAIKTMAGSRLCDWINYRQASKKPFIPNKEKIIRGEK